MEIRLNKFISDSGLMSRREADACIEKGKVTINGKLAKVGDKVTARSMVKVNGTLIEGREDYVYIALNKPVGITCTTDHTDTTNIVDFVNYPTRIFNIGRLDKDSEGLILLTDNGDVVNKILRAGNNHEKEYEVTVDKSITEQFVEKMGSGVGILGTMTKKCKVEKFGDKNFRIILKQGLNRQIRRMCEALGYNAVKLRRVRIMNINLNNISLGQWRMLEPKEMEKLLDSIKDSKGDSTASKGAGAGSVKRDGSRSTTGSKDSSKSSAKKDSKYSGTKQGGTKGNGSRFVGSKGSSKSSIKRDGSSSTTTSKGSSKSRASKDSKSPKRLGVKSQSANRGGSRGASKSAPKRSGNRTSKR